MIPIIYRILIGNEAYNMGYRWSVQKGDYSYCFKGLTTALKLWWQLLKE